MAIKKVLRMGDQRLLDRSIEVQNINDPDIAAMIEDLRDSRAHYGGVGIAGPQIGYFVRIIEFGFDHSDRYPDQPPIPTTVLINPEIEILDDTEDEDWEGCLSVPGYRGLVPRALKIRYRGLDEQGQQIERDVDEFHARLVQHEVDHLDGILFPMRMKDMSTLGCEDQLWTRLTGDAYPEAAKENLRKMWEL